MTSDPTASFVKSLEDEVMKLRALHSRIARMTAEVTSEDHSVTVVVTGDGAVQRVTIHGEASRLDRERLGSTIARTTNQALAKINAKLDALDAPADGARDRLVAELTHSNHPLGAPLTQLLAAATDVPDDAPPRARRTYTDTDAGPSNLLSR